MYLKQGHIFEFDASVFRTNFSNKIVPNYDTDPNFIIYDNLDGRSVTQGMSSNFNALFRGGLRINLGATYIDSYLESAGSKTRPYLTERFQGVWKIEQKLRASNLTIDLTGSVTGPLRLPLLGELDPRAPYSPTFSIINIQLTKGWNNRYDFYGGVKNLLNFTPAKNSIVFVELGDAQPSSGNPYGLTFDPTYVYASNQGIRFFMGFHWTLD